MSLNRNFGPEILRLTTFADRECNGSMIPFLRTRIGELDEFGLLLAILHSHSGGV